MVISQHSGNNDRICNRFIFIDYPIAMFYQYFYPIKCILSSWTSISIGLLSLVRFWSTNYIRTRCHSIISHFAMCHKCRYCGLSFKQNPHRLRHELNSHADDQSVRCVFCEQNFQEISWWPLLYRSTLKDFTSELLRGKVILYFLWMKLCIWLNYL